MRPDGSGPAAPVAPSEAEAELRRAVTRLVAVCPWTARQSVATLAEYVKEEADELAAEVRSAGAAGSSAGRVEAELGDLLFDVLLLAAVAERDVDGVAEGVVGRAAASALAKLGRRAPYAFDGTEPPEDEAAAQELWLAAKAQEAGSSVKSPAAAVARAAVGVAAGLLALRVVAAHR